MSETTKVQKSLDWGILFIYLGIVALGIYSIFSVQYSSSEHLGIGLLSKGYIKQLIWLIVSLIVGVLILFTESKFFSNIAFLAYAIGLFLIFLVVFIGSGKKGSNSWLDLGFFAFQPGELGKFLTSLALARLISGKEFNMALLKHKLIAGAMVMVPCILIILQNETGLALVYFSFFLMLYREGYPLSILIIGFSSIALVILSLIVPPLVLLVLFTIVAGLFIYFLKKAWIRKRNLLYLIIGIWLVAISFSQIVVPFAFKNVLQGYQKERIYSMLGRDVPAEFRSKSDAPSSKKGNTSDYNSRQAIIAIASGGILGKGPLNGTQTRGAYVPEQSTDFIFCTIGEELGSWGVLLLMGLYALMLIKCINLGERQRSTFGRVYAYCFASILFFHVAINLSMTVGLAPVIGIPLPFMSYGGTSLLTFSIIMFVMLRLDLDKNAIIR